MSKELDALETFNYIMARCKDEDSYIIKFPLGIQKGTTFGEDMEKAYKVIKQALQRLEAIDNANPSEALKWLEKYRLTILFNTSIVENALIKAQEQEKENAKYRQLEKELGCPLEIVGRLLLHKERYMYTIEKSKLTGEDFMDKHKIVGVSEFGVCILITNYILKTEPKYYEWNQYGKTWWLKPDRSE